MTLFASGTLFYDQCERRGLIFDPTVNKVEDAPTIKTSALTCAQTKELVLDELGRVGVAIENRGSYDT